METKLRVVTKTENRKYSPLVKKGLSTPNSKLMKNIDFAKSPSPTKLKKFNLNVNVNLNGNK